MMGNVIFVILQSVSIIKVNLQVFRLSSATDVHSYPAYKPYATIPSKRTLSPTWLTIRTAIVVLYITVLL